MITRLNSDESLRHELGELLQMQSRLLEQRRSGSATDTEILEYELRQEVIHDICQQLAHSDMS